MAKYERNLLGDVTQMMGQQGISQNRIDFFLKTGLTGWNGGEVLGSARSLVVVGDKLTRNENAGVPTDGKAKNMPPELFMTWDDLQKANAIGDIKKGNYTLYAVLYNNEFGSYPSDLREKCDFDLRTIYENEWRTFFTDKLNSMKWDDLMAQGLTNKLKELDGEGYCQKYFTEFGKYPLLYYQIHGDKQQ